MYTPEPLTDERTLKENERCLEVGDRILNKIKSRLGAKNRTIQVFGSEDYVPLGNPAKNLRELRRKCGISLRELSFVSGIHDTTLSRYEHGHRPIGADSALRLSHTFFVDVITFYMKHFSTITAYYSDEGMKFPRGTE